MRPLQLQAHPLVPIGVVVVQGWCGRSEPVHRKGRQVGAVYPVLEDDLAGIVAVIVAIIVTIIVTIIVAASVRRPELDSVGGDARGLIVAVGQVEGAQGVSGEVVLVHLVVLTVHYEKG